MDEEEVFDSLYKWLRSFETNQKNDDTSVESLAAAKPFAVFLNSVDSEYFDEDWLSKIQDISQNGNGGTLQIRLRTSNLRKLCNQLLRYFEDILEKPIPQSLQPDIKAIAENADKSSLAKILRLVVFVAMESSEKQKYIEKTVQMDTFVQQVVMQAINTITEATSSQSGSDEKVKELETDLDLARQEIAEMSRKCHELDRQISALQDENQSLVIKNESLSKKTVDDSSIDDPQSPPGRRFRQLQDTVDRHQESLNAVEIEKDELETKLELATKENEELKLRVEQLAEMEMNYLRLKDEADELRSRADEAKKFETALATCKRKLEELSDVKAQNKVLQDKIDIYMKSVIQLEEEQRKNSALKQQMESNKRQIHEIEEKLGYEIKRADNADFQWKRAKEKIGTLEQDKIRLETELKDTRDRVDELKTESSEFTTNNQDSGPKTSTSLHDSFNGDGLTELREKLLRLEIENGNLKEGASEEVTLLKSQLEDALSRKQKLDTELRLANQKTMGLEHQIKDLTELQEKGLAGKDVILSNLHEENEKLKVEAEKNLRHNNELSKSVPEKEELIKKLDLELKAKVKEYKELETKFKTYMEKARTAIVGMEASRNGGGPMSRTNSSVSTADSSSKLDPEAMRKELEKKDKEIQRLQDENEKNRILSEQETKLLTTHFQTQVVELQRQAGAERMSSAGLNSSHSLLSRQREITTPQRRQPTNLSASSTFRFISKRPILTSISGVLCFFIFLGWMSGGERALSDLDELFRTGSSISYVDGPPPV